jgi:hypothetical protein
MAAIDKIYLDSYEEYQQLKEWAKNKYVDLKYGGREYVSNWIYDFWTKKEFEEQCRPVSCFPIAVDIYLIRECPLDFVQRELQHMYGSEYDEIKNYNSVFDTYQRNGKGKDIRFRVTKKPSFKYKDKQFWFINVFKDKGSRHYDFWNYDEDSHTFAEMYEQPTCWSSSCATYKGNLTLRKIYRMLRKWNLPAGLTVEFTGEYVGQEYHVITK